MAKVNGSSGLSNDLIESLPALNVEPLWTKMAKLNPPVPTPKTVAHLWEYEKIRPLLIRAGHEVTEKQAERRVLMLINPAAEAPRTTDTLYAGLQLVMPGETAAAHRHSAYAMRFIIEGSRGFTAVHGKRINMQRGDVILTPTWKYHDHGSDGDSPMIWLDGLDLPQFQHFPVHFVQHYSEPRYPSTPHETSDILFPWSEKQAQLDASSEDWTVSRYLAKPTTPNAGIGGEVSKIIGAQAERINAGKQSLKRQETLSMVYHVVSGSGHSQIGDKTFNWVQGDTFCIPAWQPYEHFANDQETVYLYRFDDYPMLSSLGFYRTAKDDWYAME